MGSPKSTLRNFSAWGMLPVPVAALPIETDRKVAMPKAQSADPEQLVLLRNSERSTYRRCRQKWKWTYDERRAPEREKGALTFGTLVHAALADYYPPGRRRGPHPAKTFRTIYKERAREFVQWDEEGNRVDAETLGIAMLEGYVETYGKDSLIEILQPEISMQIDVFDKQENYLCTWVGQGDAAYRDLLTGRVGFLEHKTGKSIVEELRINSGYGEQGLSYYWAGDLFFRHNGWLKTGEPLDHVHFNWLKKALPDPRPRNAAGHYLNNPTKDVLIAEANLLGFQTKGHKIEDLTNMIKSKGIDPALLGEPSKRQPKPLFHRQKLDFFQSELQDINTRIRMEAYEMKLVREGKLPIYKNPTKDCDFDCPFVEACEIHGMGGDWQSVLDLEFTTWNPYGAHELLEEKELH